MNPRWWSGFSTVNWQFCENHRKVTVSSGAFETDVRVIFRERVNQQPIGFNVAITTASEISPEWVILEGIGQSPSIDQQFQYDLQLRQVLAPLLQAFDVLLELAGAAEGSHEQPGEDGLLYSQVGIKFFLGTKPFHVSARFAGVEDGGGELVRQPHLEGQASL